VALADTVAPPRRAAVDSAAVASPELAAARARAARAAADLGVARSSRWPRLDAAGQYAGWADDEGHDALEWNVGLQAVQPLWTGGALARGVDRAAAESRGAGEALRLTTIQVEHDVDQALARLEQARARTRSLDRAVARFEEVVRIERLALDAGAGTQTDYLRAEADLLGARADRVEARHGEIAARAELGRIMGGLDAAWIERTLEERP
jgi:outer membrane protein TolC